MRLNPFFIRFVIQISVMNEKEKSLNGLNPFFIRFVIQIEVLETIDGFKGLNPFFIRFVIQIILSQAN